MAGKEVTAEDLRVIGKFEEATGLTVDRDKTRISGAGNLCIHGQRWHGSLVLRRSDGAIVAPPSHAVQTALPELREYPWACQKPKKKVAPQTPPAPRRPSPHELYWREHEGRIPGEVVKILRKDVAKGKPFKVWQRELIGSAKVVPSENGKSVTVEFTTKGKSRALVSFHPVRASRPTGWARHDVASFADEAKAIEKNFSRIGYGMTESGEKKVRAACKREARRLGREILSSTGLDRKTHRLPGDGFDERGHDVLDGLLEGEPVVDLGKVAEHYSRRMPKTCDHWNPTFILCRVGEARLYYDIRDGSVQLSGGDAEHVMRYAEAKRFAKAYDRLRDEIRQAFDGIARHGDIRIGGVEDGKAKIAISTLAEHEREIMLDRPTKPQVARIAEDVRAADDAMRAEWREKCEETGLVGDLLAMEIMGFLVANGDRDSGNYVTAGVLEKELKGRPITIWSGVETTWLSGTLSAMTVAEHRERLDTLRSHALVHGIWRTWKNHGYRDEFCNLRATMPVGRVFMELSEAEAAADAPVDELTEMQLLRTMREGTGGKDIERLAEELPALLDHPACVLADTDAMARYVLACPEQLRDYLPLAYKLSHDRTQRKAMRILNERMDELGAEAKENGGNGE